MTQHGHHIVMLKKHGRLGRWDRSMKLGQKLGHDLWILGQESKKIGAELQSLGQTVDTRGKCWEIQGKMKMMEKRKEDLCYW